MLASVNVRPKLPHYNSIEDVCHLLRTCNNVLVLTGAGISVSSGIPDFRSENGLYNMLGEVSGNRHTHTQREKEICICITSCCFHAGLAQCSIRVAC